MKIINYYAYSIIILKDVDEWCSGRMSTNDSLKFANQRRQRYRMNMLFPGVFYSFYMMYMGTKIVSYMVLWKVSYPELDRCEDKLIACISSSRNKLPEF